MADGKLFDDLFTVSTVDRDGKKFDRVSRIEATSQAMDMSLTLDINSDIFPLAPQDRITICLASSLHASGPADMEDDEEGAGSSKREAWRGGDEGLASEFDYVVYGKCYKYEDVPGPQKEATVYISFGGLLMALRGQTRHLAELVVGENVYCLIRK